MPRRDTLCVTLGHGDSIRFIAVGDLLAYIAEAAADELRRCRTELAESQDNYEEQNLAELERTEELLMVALTAVRALKETRDPAELAHTAGRPST